MTYEVSSNYINVSALSGLGVNKIPEELQPKSNWDFRVNSFTAFTGIDPTNEQAIFDTSLMAALAGVGRYYLEDLLNSQPEFKYMYRNGRFYGTFVNSFSAAWSCYEERVEQQRRSTAKRNFSIL